MTIDREEFRKEWIAALRSGKYEQGTYSLERSGKFCCLGVGCKLLTDRGLLVRRIAQPDGDVIYDNHNQFAPQVLVDAAGLISDEGDHRQRHDNPSLTFLNDNGKTFPEIAGLLETGDYWE